MYGRWCGDRIAVVGDYAPEPHVYPGSEEEESGEWKDITALVAAEIEKELGGKFVGDDWQDFVVPEVE